MGTEFALLVTKYGYAATFVGTLLEGETFLVLSGLAAQHGFLSVQLLMLVGAAGAFLTDTLFFALGRWYGAALLTRFPRFAASVARAHRLVDRMPRAAVLAVRFFYGMRSVGPAVIGAGSMPWWRFIAIDAFAASLWSCCWVGAGYLAGEAVQQLLSEFGHIARWLLAGAVAVAVLVTGLAFLRRRKSGSASPSNDR